MSQFAEQSTISPGDVAMPCPGCGYDLRAAPASARCPECGLMIDAAAFAVSGFPWAHRRKIGRVRAYLKTIWLVTASAHRLNYESLRPQDPADGRSFRRVTAAILAPSAFICCAACFAADGGFARDLSSIALPFGIIPGWSIDLGFPWLWGMAIPLVLPFCVAWLAVVLTGMTRHVLRAPAFADAEIRSRSMTIANYLSGPIVLMAPGFLLIAALLSIPQRWWDTTNRVPFAIIAIVVFALSLLFGVGLLAPLWIAGTWMGRLTQCGWLRKFAARFEMLGLWLLAGAVLGWLLPWCVGFVWIIINTWRG